MTEHKTDMNITKVNKYKKKNKLNNTSTMKTKTNKYTRRLKQYTIQHNSIQK